MLVYWDTPAVVRDSYAVVSTDCYVDAVAIAIQGFVNCIVKGLSKEMVQTGAGGIANKHSRSQSHRCQSFEYLDVSAGVAGCHYPLRPREAVPRRLLLNTNLRSNSQTRISHKFHTLDYQNQQIRVVQSIHHTLGVIASAYSLTITLARFRFRIFHFLFSRFHGKLRNPPTYHRPLGTAIVNGLFCHC